MEKQKVTIPKREKMLRVIAKAAHNKSLIGGDLFVANIADEVGYEDTSLSPAAGCKSAGRCAMGELFFAAGYSNKELARMEGTADEWDQKDFRVLWDNYRIDATNARKIINANDDTKGCSLEAFAKRENKVAKAISGLKDRVRVDPYRYEISNGKKYRVILTREEQAVLKELEELGQYTKEDDYFTSI